jgi:hypothetical protein
VDPAGPSAPPDLPRLLPEGLIGVNSDDAQQVRHNAIEVLAHFGHAGCVNRRCCKDFVPSATTFGDLLHRGGTTRESADLALFVMAFRTIRAGG